MRRRLLRLTVAGALIVSGVGAATPAATAATPTAAIASEATPAAWWEFGGYFATYGACAAEGANAVRYGPYTRYECRDFVTSWGLYLYHP